MVEPGFMVPVGTVTTVAISVVMPTNVMTESGFMGVPVVTSLRSTSGRQHVDGALLSVTGVTCTP